MTTIRRLGLLFGCTLPMAACGADGEAPTAELVERRTIGDTVEVITHLPAVEPLATREVLSIGESDGDDLNYIFGGIGSIAVGPNGHTFVLDSQVKEVREFDPTGNWVRNYGREGEGPGEFSMPTAIAVRPDGAVFARDSRNVRLQGFAPEPVQFPVVQPGYLTMMPLWTDTGSRLFVVTRNPEAEFGSTNAQLIRVVDADGTVVREGPPPFSDLELAVARAESSSEQGRGFSSAPVPFSPQGFWAVHPSGAWVGGVSDRYRIQIWGPDREGVLRFGRSAEPVPVAPDERRLFMDRVQNALRNTEPDWDWGGLDVPQVKPPFTSVYAALDGRTWVRTSQPGFTVPDPREPDDPDATVWTEPTQYDVFSATGEYEMSVIGPEGLAPGPAPVFRGDSIWGVSRDDLGVAFVKKWVVDRAGSEP